MEPDHPSFQPWSDTTKRMVVVGGVVLGALILYGFRGLLPPLVIAIAVAYVLNPAVRFVVVYTRLPRTTAVALLYLGLIILLVLPLPLLAPSLIKQLRAVDLDLKRMAEEFDRFLDRPLFLLGYRLELETAWKQVRWAFDGLVSPITSRTLGVLLDAVTSLVWLVFIIVTSFYILKEQDAIARYARQLIPPHYRADARLLGAEINAIWNAFLRGQLILCLVVGFVVGVATAAVGLRNSLGLGVLAGGLEVLPNIGPALAAIPAVLLALFQGSSYLPLPPFWFALVVAGMYVLIQQLENNYLVPRIIGHSLNLNPLVVIVAVVAGANLAGVLGALLAAPALASFRVLAGYVYRKLLDQPPFPSSVSGAEEAGEEGVNQEPD